MAFITSHVEIAEKDITVNGRAIGKGQAHIVSDLEFVGGGGGAGGVDYVKIASFIGPEIQCFKMKEVFTSVSGSDLVTTADSTTVTSASTDWVAVGVKVGDYLKITSGIDSGSYRITTVAPDKNANALQLECDMSATATGISFEVALTTTWEVDYATLFVAYPEPGSPLWRYRPYLGPGDHVGCNLVTAVGSSEVTAPGHNFGDDNNPVPTGAYIEIYQGADAGRYRITLVKGNTLTLDTNMTTVSPDGGLAYRINLVSEHATTLAMVAYDGKNTLTGMQDGIEVKIKKPIRTLQEAIDFDTQREQGTHDAEELWAQLGGQFLACYRLQVGASDTQGFPLDDRVLIGAKPWRGHAVDGVLFQTTGGSQKYTGSSANPVFPIRWLRDNWRLEIAIARDTRAQPLSGESCI